MLATGNLITNGDFGLGNTGFTNDYIYGSITSDGHCVVGYDVAASYYGTSGNEFPDHTTGTGLMLMLNGRAVANSAVWVQSVSVSPSTSYTFSGWAASWGDLGGAGDPHPGSLLFQINGVSVGTGLRLPSTCQQWVQWSLQWNSGSATTAVVRIVDTETNPLGNDFAMDDLSLTALPPANSAPTDLAISAASVAENQPIGTSVGTFSTTDPDSGDAFTYALVSGTGSDDNALFAISGNTLRTTASLNYESKSTCFVRVRATDSGGLWTEKALTIAVTNVNDAPVLSPIPSSDISEGNTLTFTAVASDPDLPAQTLTYSLLNSPSGATIDPATGLFSWTPTEAQGPATYSLTLLVSDGALAASQTFQITVTEARAAPLLAPIADRSIAEGSTLTFTASLIDPDPPLQPLLYSLASGAPVGAAINPTTGVFTWTPSESQGPGTCSITVRASDGTLSDAKTFQVTVTEANIAPILQPIADKSTAEGSILSFTAIATDPDLPAQSLTYSLSNAPAGASLDPATGHFTWTPSEAQGPGIYRLTINVSDGLLSDAKAFQVTVTEVNIGPMLTTSANLLLPENQPIGSLVVTLSATDPDLPANPLTYSLVPGTDSADNSLFTIQGNQLCTTARFDYETKSSYSLRVRVSDASGFSSQKALTLSITDLPEFGQLQGKLQRLTLPDADGDLVTFALTGGGSGTLQPDQRLTLTATTPQSILCISVKKSPTGDGYYTLPGIASEGPLKSLSATKVFISGDIALNTDAPGTRPVTISIAGIRDGSINTHGQPLNSLKLLSWQDTDTTPDQLIAPWIGAIRASGDWQADILTSSSNAGIALKSLKLAGSISQSTIWAAGTLKTLSAKGPIANSRIAAADGITSLTASALQDSDILVGVNQDYPGHYATAFANPAAKLAKLTITGRKLPPGQLHPAYVTNSHLSAPLYGKITLTNVPATTSTPILHVLTDTGTLKLRSLSPEMLPAGTWLADQAPRPGQPERPNLVEVLG